MVPGKTHKHPHLSGTIHAVQMDLLDLFLRVEKALSHKLFGMH